MRKLLIASILAILTLGSTALLVIHLAGPGKTRMRENAEPGGPKARADVASAGATPAPAAPAGAEDAATPGEPSRAEGGAPALHGTVTHDKTKPIPEARVIVVAAGASMKDPWDRSLAFRERLLGDARTQRSGAVVQTTTDAEGRYSIPVSAMPAGKYRVIASREEYASLQRSWEWTATSSELNFDLKAGRDIRGRILRAGGQPFPGATVEAYKGGQAKATDRSPKDLAAHVEAGPDGTFRLGVSKGKYLVVAFADGYAQKAATGVPAGTESLEIVLSEGREITGAVVDAGGTPLAGAKVSAFLESAKEGKSFRSGARARLRKGDPLLEEPGARPEDELAALVLHLTESPAAVLETGADGKFDFRGLSRGRYVLLAEKGGFEPGAGKSDLTEKAPPAPLELKLPRGHVLRGTVTDPDGKPVPGAFVSVSEPKLHPAEKTAEAGRKKPLESAEEDASAPKARSAPGGSTKKKVEKGAAPRAKLLPSFETEAAVRSDAAGSFELTTLRRAAYVLKVQADGFLPYRKEGVQVDEPADVAVKLDAGVRIEGKVLTRAEAKPIPRARIRVDLNELDRREVLSDEEGLYKLPGLPAGRVKEVEVTAKGFSASVRKDLDVAAEPAVQPVDFQLDAAASVSGTVTDAKGAPVSKARVLLAPVPGGQPKKIGAVERAREIERVESVQGTTDEAGRFTLSGASTGPAFHVTVTHSDFKPLRSDPFPIRAGESVQGLRLRLLAGARVELSVRDAAGAVAGAKAKLVGLRPAEERSVAIIGLDKPKGRHESTSQQSDQQGKAVFSALEGGEYALVVASKGHQTYSTAVTAVEEQSVSIVAALSPESVITGTVQDRSGAALRGVKITAEREVDPQAPKQEERWHATSDAEGAFRVGGLGDGKYLLRARREGFAEAFVRAESGGTATITLERLGGVSGSVAAAETGEPVVRFEVRWMKAEAASPIGGRGGAKGGADWRGADRISVEDPGGAFRIDGLSPGSYVLRVLGEDNSGAQVRVVVRDGSTTDGVKVLLEQGVSLLGFVGAAPGNTAVGGAKVYLLPHGDGKSAEGAREQKDAAARETKREKQKADARLGIPHTVKSAAARLASILAKLVEGNASPVAVTDGEGSFKLKDVAPGTYHLLVEHDALLPALREVVIGDDGIALDVAVSLDAGESLGGSVLLPEGGQAAGSLVIARESAGWTRRAVVDAAGKYMLRGLLQGTYTLTVRTGEQTSAPEEVKVAAGFNHHDFRGGSGSRSGAGQGKVERAGK